MLRAFVAGGMMLVTSSLAHAQTTDPRVLVAGHRLGISAALADSDARPADSFVGSDKVKHFLMSGFIEAMGYSALQAINVDRRVSLGAATATTLGIGVARELHDRRTNGLFSVGDLTWDTLGASAALLLISHTQRQEPRPNVER